MKKLIVAHGDKGGVGKTHVALLTAAVLQTIGKPLTIIDGDAKNPGLYRYFNEKPDPVLRINARKPEGVDALIETFLGVPGDVLVDLPAGGSDTTAGFVGAGSAAGSVDIESIFKEIDARLVVLFTLDQGRDGIVALADEMKRLPESVTDWVIVRNHRLDVPFDRLDNWLDGMDLGPAKIIDMPSLDRRVIELLVTEKKHIGEIDTIDMASALMKIRAKAALRVWTAELRKAGLLDG
jgi:hypothetical protein